MSLVKKEPDRHLWRSASDKDDKLERQKTEIRVNLEDER